MSENKELILALREIVVEQNDVLRKSIDDRLERMGEKLNQITLEMTKFKTLETDTNTLLAWKARIDDVASPSQLKEMKDELYRQKNRWTAAIAIFLFIQVAIGLYSNFKKDFQQDIPKKENKIIKETNQK